MGDNSLNSAELWFADDVNSQLGATSIMDPGALTASIESAASMSPGLLKWSQAAKDLKLISRKSSVDSNAMSSACVLHVVILKSI